MLFCVFRGIFQHFLFGVPAYNMFTSGRWINFSALNDFPHNSSSSIGARSGSDGRDWPLTAIPPTATTRTRVLSNGHAASQIDIFFRLEGAVTFPASHGEPYSFNVGVGTIGFVAHVIAPWPGSSVDDPTGRAGAVLASCASAAPLCSLQSRSLFGLVGHNDLEVYDL